MTDLILREFNGVSIRQRKDGYFCLTDMAKAVGKEFRDWNRLSSTEDILSVLSRNVGIPTSQLIQVNRGNTDERGSWGHRKVAIAFATWCCPEFFSVVIDWADEIITKGYAIASDATSEQLEAAQKEIEENQTEIKRLRKQIANIECDTEVNGHPIAHIRYVMDKYPAKVEMLEQELQKVKAQQWEQIEKVKTKSQELEKAYQQLQTQKTQLIAHIKHLQSEPKDTATVIVGIQHILRNAPFTKLKYALEHYLASCNV